MKTNAECANIKCTYTTGRNDNLKIKDLSVIVKEQGGKFEVSDTCCPKCKRNSLVLVLE